MHARFAGDREQQRPARHRRDRRDRVALLDEDVEHATRERRAHRRVAELHVERGEPRLGLGEQRRRLLAAGPGFVLRAGGRGVATAELLDAALLDPRVAQLDARRLDGRARLAHLGFEQLALQLDQHLPRRDEVVRVDADLLDDPGGARPHLDLALRLDGAGGDDDALDAPALDRGARRRHLIGAARTGGERRCKRNECSGAREAPDTACAHVGTSRRACGTEPGDAAMLSEPERGRQAEAERDGPGDAELRSANQSRSKPYTVVWA